MEPDFDSVPFPLGTPVSDCAIETGHIDFYREADFRQTALAHAMVLAQRDGAKMGAYDDSRLNTPDNVVKAAETFLAFLKGGQ